MRPSTTSAPPTSEPMTIPLSAPADNLRLTGELIVELVGIVELVELVGIVGKDGMVRF